MMMWTRGGAFFSFFSFERERVLFSLVGTEKKTPLGKRETLRERRDETCLKSYDVIVFFFLDNTIAVVSPIINRIFSHKRHFKNHFDCEAKKATRAVLVPTTKTTTHGTRNFTLS